MMALVELSLWVVTVVVVVLLLVVAARAATTRRSTTGSKLPLGPKGLPVVGNLFMLGRAQKHKGQHRVFADLASIYGDIMHLRLGRVPLVVASSAEAARLFFKVHDAIFASRPALGVSAHVFYGGRDSVFAPYGDFWRQSRKLCVVHLLTTRKVESFQGLREAETVAMIADLGHLSGHAVDLAAAFRRIPFNVVWKALAGDTFPELADHLKCLVTQINKFIALPLVGDFVPWLSWLDLPNIRQMKKVFLQFDNFAQNLLDGFRKQVVMDDSTFVGSLLKLAQKDPTVTDPLIKALILDMFIAGTETISSTLEWATALLLRHPSCLKRLQQELDQAIGLDRQVQESDIWNIKYLHCVVKESMRLSTATPLGLPHFSTEQVTVRDFTLPKGTVLFVNHWAINRDPAVWDNPEEFRPERFMEDDTVDLSGLSDCRNFPFGSGRRACPGTAMALPSVLLVLARLFHTFDLSPHGDVDMEEGHGNIMGRKNPLMVLPRLRLKNVKLP